jgi:hypothetical protein
MMVLILNLNLRDIVLLPLKLKELKLTQLLPVHDLDTLLASDDPTRNFQYPLITVTRPPTGIPDHCLSILWSRNPCYIALRSQFLVSSHESVHCGIIRGFLGVHQERARHLLTHPFMIHPHSNFILAWSIFIGLYTAAILVYEPFMIAFRPLKYYNLRFEMLSMYGSIILLMDIVFRFIAGTVDRYSLDVILDPREVSKRYVRGWFFFDLLTRFPWDFILFFQLSSEDRHTKAKLGGLRVLSFVLRILRYRQVHFLLRRIASTVVFRGMVASWLLKLVVLIYFTLHWHACFHWLMPDIMNAHLHTPKTHSWVTGYKIWGKPVWIQYIHSYLRSISNLLTLDGGDYIPREPEEILCTCIGICLSVSLFGYFISSFSTILSELNIAEEKYGQMLDLVEEYLTFQNVPEKYRQRVLLYFEKKFCKHIFSDAVLLATLSPSLRTELICQNCRGLVEKVSLFKNLPPGVIVNIAKCLKYEVFVPGDVLIIPFTVGDCMYFIQDGEVEILSIFGVKIAQLTDGNFFGEISLVTGELRKKTAVAKTPCQIYILSKTDFQQCVEPCPEIYAQILEVARQRLEADHAAEQEAAKKDEEFRKWKAAGKKMKNKVQFERNMSVDDSGIEFVGEAIDSSEEEEEDDEEEEGSIVEEDDDNGTVSAQKLEQLNVEVASVSSADNNAQKRIQNLLKNVKGLARRLRKK